jgi:uncharacterized MAPEG superfamily protein
VHYVPYIAICIACAQIYLPRQIVSHEAKKLAGGYDNHDPRGQQQKLEGLGKRALGAHHNGFEAFAPFAIGVLACAQRGVRVELVAWIAIAFVVARSAYIAAYLADNAKLRSMLWGVGMTATAALLISAAASTP